MPHPAHISQANFDMKFPPLRMVFWETTARCNLECVHCRRLDLEQCKDELTTEQTKSMIDSIAEMGKPVLVFSGGEPLERNDWAELAQYATDLDIPIALATNGTLVTEEIANKIAQVGFRRVSISIDGPTAKLHDSFRGLPGAFESALKGARLIMQAGVEVQFNVTVTTHNQNSLEELYDLAIAEGVKAMHMFLLVPVGCGVELAETQQLGPEKYEQVLNWICDKQQLDQLEIRSTCGPHYYRVAAQRKMKQARGRGCLCGISVMFVSHKGQVFPCGYLPIECGNVKEQSIKDIWSSSETFAKLRDYELLTGKCGDCNFKKICGGCRARAFGATGNFLSEEPFCNYNPDK